MSRVNCKNFKRKVLKKNFLARQKDVRDRNVSLRVMMSFWKYD